MLKSLAILGALSVLAISNSGKEENRTAFAQHNGDHRPFPAVFFPRDQATSPDAETPKAQPPHWYASPEWWLCILGVPTLVFIGWQARATYKAADATKASADATRVQSEISRKAFISQFRPKVPVRSMWLLDKDGALTVEIWLTNVGGTTARIIGSDIKIGWEVPRELKKKLVASAAFQAISLRAGRDHSATVDITEIRTPHDVARIAVEEMGRDQEAWISCFGHLTYVDDNEAARSTGFFRKYDIKRKRFIPSDDPDEEYTD